MVMPKTPEAFWSRVEEGPALIVFDLTCNTMDTLGLITGVKAHPRGAEIPTLAFLPHVQEELRQKAIAAGCGRVMPRSAFSGQVDVLIREAIVAAAPS